MKAKIAIYFCVALLPSIICCEKTIDQYEQDVINISTAGGRINDLFEPKGDTALAKGNFNFVYRGILHPGTLSTDIWRTGTKEIAMKFTPSLYEHSAMREYEMYSYLDAIGNEKVEQYGIPTVYYFRPWNENGLMMLGISLLEQTFDGLKTSNRRFRDEVNILIILRDFILSSKYMHSRGVTHNDIELKNLMVRKHRSFIIDFNMSLNLTNKVGALTVEAEQRMDDWKSFLHLICYSFGVPFGWMKRDSRRWVQSNENILNDINTIQSKSLKYILAGLVSHVFDDSVAVDGPQYNYFYHAVNRKIEETKLPPPVLFTWLTGEQRNEAIADLAEHKMPNITEIQYDYKS